MRLNTRHTSTVIKVLTVAILFLIPFNQAVAENACGKFYSHTTIKDSAVELELSLTEHVVKYITTMDGTLAPLFTSPNKVPPDVKQFIIKKGVEEKNILEYPVENLPASLKLKAIQQAIISKNMKFLSAVRNQRKIPGLIVKEEIQERYSLLETVELGNPQATKDGSFIELHLRTNKLPGEVALMATKVQKLLKGDVGPFHMHVVFDLMVPWLKQNPNLNSWRLVEYWRRLNLAMEFRDVFENGYAILSDRYTFEGATYDNFLPLSYRGLREGFNYFSKISEQGNESSEKLSTSYNLGSSSKMGWIGLWGHDKYDKPNLFGFELRFLTGKDLPTNLIEFLNQLPEKMKSREFGLDEKDLHLWGEFVSYKTQKHSFIYLLKILRGHEAELPNAVTEEVFQVLNPHRSYEDLIRDLNPELKQIVLSINQQFAYKEFNSKGRLRYLLHNWQLDPLIFKNPALQANIYDAQLKALRQWRMNPRNERQIIQTFLLESGLYMVFAESVNLKI